MIQRKTAKLFEAAAQLGAVLGGARAEREAALARYGMHLGTAFQLIDDVLDYSGNLGAIGKNLGDDLAEGKMTLPLIRALRGGQRRRRGAHPRSAITRRPIDRFRAGDGRAASAPARSTTRRAVRRARKRGGRRAASTRCPIRRTAKVC